MAEGDDDQDGGGGRPDGAGDSPLDPWGDPAGSSPSRGPRSWSQIAALDGDAAQSEPGSERPVEGLLSVDSGLLDIMALESGAPSGTPASVNPDEAPTQLGPVPGGLAADAGAFPSDFDLDEALDAVEPDPEPLGGGPGDSATIAPDDGGLLDDSGALPDDFDFDALEGLEGLDDLDGLDAFEELDGAALPDDLDFDTIGGSTESPAEPPLDEPGPEALGELVDAAGDEPLVDDPDGALPLGVDVEALLAEEIGASADEDDAGATPEADALGGALPIDLDYEAELQDAEAFGLEDPVGAALEAEIDAELGVDLDAEALGDDLDGMMLGESEDELGETLPPDLAASLDGDLEGDLAAELDALGAGIGSGGDGDDWLDNVLDQVDAHAIGEEADSGWGDLLEDDDEVAALGGTGPVAALTADPEALPAVAEDADLWDLVPDEPEEAIGPSTGASPFDDPFAAPIGAGLADETNTLGDPFARIGDSRPGRSRLSVELPTVGVDAPEDEAGPTAEPRRADETLEDESPRPPTPDEIAWARQLLARRAAERRALATDEGHDPSVMRVEEVLLDGPERVVTRIEYPRLDEMEILEVPEEGAELPGLDEDFDLDFGDGYVFFSEADREEERHLSDTQVRRSALDALSREPVELAAMLAPPGAAGDALEDAPDPLDSDEIEPETHALAVVPDDAPPAAASVEHEDITMALDRLESDALALPDGSNAGLALVRPAWDGAAADTFDPDDIERMGVPFLGVIPPFEAPPPGLVFPPGSAARRPIQSTDGPAMIPVLDLPSRQQGDGWPARLVRFLGEEVGAEADRERLAMLLAGIGRVAWRDLGDEALALQALSGAVDNDPELGLARWMLVDLLEQGGAIDALTARITAPRGGDQVPLGALHRSGHLALAHEATPATALARWEAASVGAQPDPAALLARYLVHIGKIDWERAAAVVDELLEQAEGPVWWTALALERVRLEEELSADPTRLDPLLEEALRRRGGAPAVVAAAERHALGRGRMALWLHALRARYDAVMADYEGGTLDHELTQQALSEVFVKAGLALDRLGRRAEALTEFDNALKALPDDPYVLHKAAELARRLGDHPALRRYLGRLARLSPSPAERADAAYQMGLVAIEVMADDAAAEEDFKLALEAMPTFTPALAALGRLDLRRGRLGAIQDRYAEEIRQLEAALREPRAPRVRATMIRGLIDRYFRLARLLEETGDAAVALDVYKRALALDPSFLPAFDAIERTYIEHHRWRERASLILGLLQRQKQAPLETVGPLLTAADTVRLHLDDDGNAARLYARALALAPDHPYALRRASETFARLDNLPARIEVDLRWGRLAGAARASERLLRAAQLQELDGDSLAAAAEALPLYREALAAAPDATGAIDGLLRTAGRLGRTGELLQQIELHDLSAHPAPMVVLPLAETLLAGGRAEEAAGLLSAWRARWRAAEALDTVTDAAALALLGLAWERADAWRELADVLEERAELLEGPPAAALLARAGALWELRLDDPAIAEDAYERALDLDPGCVAARRGLERIAPGQPGRMPADPWRIALARARGVDEAGGEARAEALDALAAVADDARDAVAWRLLARGESTPVDAAGALYAANPERADLFGLYRRRLEEAGDSAGLVRAMWLRLDYEDEPGQVALLTSLIGHAMRLGDHRTVRAAARKLLDIDARSLPALLALRRLARVEGDVRGSAETSRKLTGVLKAPRSAAEIQHASALEAEAEGADPRAVRRLLTQAVTLNPGDDEVARALGERLQAAEDWSGLVALYDRRLAALDAPELRRPVARERAQLLADRFDDLEGAYAGLRRELDALADPETALLAADFAERQSNPTEADRCFAEAIAADGGRMASPATRLHAAALQRRGESQRAGALLEQLLAQHPRDRDALEQLAEVLASQRRWKSVVRVFRRLMTLEVEPGRRAERAMAIAEIFARIYKDRRRAAGWFKRAIELDPTRLRAVWRLLEEAEAAEEGAVPIGHVHDAIDRAVEAQRARLTERPVDGASLEALARLHARRKDRDGQLLVGEALCWLGLADEKTRAWVESARSRMSFDFGRPMTEELRGRHLEHPDERGRARLVFDAFALVLTEVLAGSMPAGVPRLSRRSYAPWQAECRRLSTGLGVDDVELWNAGRQAVSIGAAYLPRPALAVPVAFLDGPLDPRQAFELGRLLEGLRGGRLLLDRPGVERIELCARVMAGTLAPGIMGPAAEVEVPDGLRRRLVERARRLPRRIKLQLDTLATQGGPLVRFDHLAAAVEATRDRAGLLSCGDLGLALDTVLFEDLATAESTRRAGGMAAALQAKPAGRALLTYALGADFGRLRALLGLGLSRRTV